MRLIKLSLGFHTQSSSQTHGMWIKLLRKVKHKATRTENFNHKDYHNFQVGLLLKEKALVQDEHS